MITAIVLILIISVLVLIHEFGHFYVAKKVGVRVEEFGLGLPPRVWGKKIGETLYSINWLPFGGFVKLTGELFDDDEEVPAADPRNFKSKTPLQRATILIAGIFMNIVLAIVIYFCMFFITDFKSMTLPLFFDYDFRYGTTERLETVVTDYLEGSTADQAGIKMGEAIVEIGGRSVSNAEEIKAALADKNGVETPVKLIDVRKIEREERTVVVVPQANEDGVVLLGVLLTDAFRLDYSGSKLTSGFAHTYNMFTYSASTLGSLVGLSVETKDISPVSDSVSGPVGISRAVSGILSYSGIEVVVGIFDLVGLLSISLALMNMLPFPALDGGRLAFVLIEMFSKKKVSEQIEGTIHQWGMIILLALLVLVTVKDVFSLL